MTTISKLGAPFSVGSFNPAPSTLGYVSDMVAYQVRALQGPSYAPTNGKASLQSATSADWLSNDPGTNPGNMADFWGGGVGDPANNLVYCFGGGHNNSYNNTLYTYDFNGTTKPTGFTAVRQSLTSAIIQAASLYSDGNISSRHPYDGCAFVPGKFYQFGGAVEGPGSPGFISDLVRYTGSWTKMGNPGFAMSERMNTVAFGTKIFAWCSLGNNAAFYNTATETWGANKSPPGGLSVDYYTIIHVPTDAVSGRVFVLGGGVSAVWNVNWSTETVTAGTAHAVSGMLSSSGLGAVYDDVRKCIWVVGTSSTVLGRLDTLTNTYTQTSMSGDAMAWNTGQVPQVYKRLVLLSDYSGIGIVTGFTNAAYVIKLPAIYITSFPATEAIISEGGIWTNGAADGGNWHNVSTLANTKAYSLVQMGTGSQRFSDAIAHLKTSVIPVVPNQFAEAVFYKAAGYNGNGGSHECELLLRFSITNGVARGYEVLFGLNYLAIVRWNGALTDYTPLYDPGAASLAPVDGDVFRAHIVGSTITVFKNGVAIPGATATDSTWATGQPGQGMWPVDGATPANMGWKSWKGGSL